MKEPPVLMVILDAGRADYVNPEIAPFLSSLKEGGVTGRLESPPGFAQRTTMFTGTHPDSSGNFSAFGYDPERSPFKWVSRLGPLHNLYRPRRAMFPARVAVKHVTRWLTGAYHTDPAWIPMRYLPYFSMVEDTRPVFDPGALPFTSVFDLLRERGKAFRYLAHPVSGDDEKTLRLALETWRMQPETSFVVAQFSATDERGHRHGPVLPEGTEPAEGQTAEDVERMRREIRGIDEKVRRIVESMERRFAERHVIVVGDHGMAPVRRRVNVLKALERTGLRAGDDYVVFLDSTVAKLWFRNERAEREVRDAMRALGCGRFLEREERRRLRIDFKDRRYGDAMFAADPGVLFWPDYFHAVDSVVKGMHGYVDKREETYGALVVNGPSAEKGRDVGLRPLADVFPTLCGLAGLPVPAHAEGRSLL